MTDGALSLLRSLASALKGHSRRDVEELATILSDRELTDALVIILRNLPLHEQSGKKPRRKSQATNLGAVAPDKLEILERVIAALSNRKLHPSLAGSVNLLRAYGIDLPRERYRSREELARDLAGYAQDLDRSELAEFFKFLVTPNRMIAGDLHSWSQIIEQRKEPD